MCGICGAVQIGGNPRAVLDAATLDRMTNVMTHRGPNDRGTYQAAGIALGVRRLSIVDVEGGHQPVSSEDRSVWAVQNGELYNHGDARSILASAGHRFSSRCDTEILPHLYEQHGAAFPEHLRGKFAIAVWDERQRRAVLVRDRLGVKPLYFAVCGDLVVFASELKGVLASGLVDPELDYEAIDAYLALGFFPGPLTPLAGVKKLAPGHRLVVDDCGVRAESYWDYPAPMPNAAATTEEHAERLIAELDEAVRLRLMSDVPLGAMLSGGLDSSVVVALMARHMSGPVKTFSVGFVEDGRHNELADARLVAHALGTDHHELELSMRDASVSVEDLVWHLDEPLADLSALGFLALSELAARHVTVALSGQGADELLGGYRKHRAAALAGTWRRLPRPLRAIGERTLDRGRTRRTARTLAAVGPAQRLLAMSGSLDGATRMRLVRGPLAQLDGGGAQRAVSICLNGVPDDPLPAALYLDARLGLVDDMLHYFDRASMARSLEVRVPFLDHRVVEYCARIPSNLKVRRQTTKYLLRHAARQLVPDHVLDKPKVGFFSRSVDRWFREQTHGVVREYLLRPHPHYAEFLDQDEVRGLIDDGKPRVGGEARLPLAVLMLEVWLSSFLPRAMKAAAPQRTESSV